MYDKILREMRIAAQAGRVRFTSHALDELDDDGLTTADAVNCILTGEIIEDQFDQQWEHTKYKFYGDSLAGGEIGLIARWDDRDKVIVITIFRLRIDDYE